MNISLGQPSNAVVVDHQLHQTIKSQNDLTYIYILEMSFSDVKATGWSVIAVQNGLTCA